ncbi:MAG: hypothetical protein LBP62_01825 [Clostridiales bacterium]|nr:hypothetical protein [Clostridiales bacterium]
MKYMPDKKQPRYAMTPGIGVALSYAVTVVVCVAGLIFYYDKSSGTFSFSPNSDAKTILILFAAFFALTGAVFLPKWLARYTFDERGVKESAAGIAKKFVAWENVKEVRYSVYGTKPLLFISEYPLDGLSYSEIKKIKAQITVICSMKTLEAVRAFYKEKIVNYPENSVVV